jgi:hypothetical protein
MTNVQAPARPLCFLISTSIGPKFTLYEKFMFERINFEIYCFCAGELYDIQGSQGASLAECTASKEQLSGKGSDIQNG